MTNNQLETIKVKKQYFLIDFKKLQEKRQKLGMSWPQLATLLDIDYVKLLNTRQRWKIEGVEDYTKLSEWINEGGTGEVKETSESLLQRNIRIVEGILKSRRQVSTLNNQKYISEFTFTGYKWQRVYKRANFERVESDANLLKLKDFYYRIPASKEIIGTNVNIQKASHLRHYKDSIVSVNTLNEWFKKDEIEVFTKA